MGTIQPTSEAQNQMEPLAAHTQSTGGAPQHQPS